MGLMYTPHTVTLYNEREADDGGSDVNATILRGVLLDDFNAARATATGPQGEDSATLFVPFGVQAVGLNGNAKTYVQPREYAELADVSDVWTLDTHGSKSNVDCYFVKGECGDEVASFNALNNAADRVYRVQAVYYRDFGAEQMQHWEVRAR